MTAFKNILTLCERHSFFKYVSPENAIKTVVLGSNGALLQENLRSEWLHSTVINRDIYVSFSAPHNLFETFKYTKEQCCEKLPFGIAYISQSDETQDVNLEHTIFVSPSDSVQFFYQYQRQRRMWWRKISATPSRYILTDVETTASKDQSVEIHSVYPWGPQILEKLSLLSNETELIPADYLMIKNGRKQFIAHCIKSTISLTSMLLNTVCDAYDESSLNGQARVMLRLHRKLAPYKISFAISGSNTEELSELALYLCKQLRRKHISALLTPSSTKRSLESQWQVYDQLGIPYSLQLNDSTLRNGITYLRNRDTTLKEQVHVGDLGGYVEKLFKNY